MEFTYSDKARAKITDIINDMSGHLKEARDCVDDLARATAPNHPITPATVEADGLRERDYLNALRELHQLRSAISALCQVIENPDELEEEDAQVQQ